MKFPSLDKYQREGVISLWVLIVIYVFGLRLFDYFYQPEVVDFTSILLEDSLTRAQIEDSLKNLSSSSYDKYGPKKTSTTKKFLFDPNLISKDSLSLLGLPDRIVNNIMKYREKGGKFKNLEHFGKTYGIAPFMDQLAPYVDIKEKPKKTIDSSSFDSKNKFKNFYEFDSTSGKPTKPWSKEDKGVNAALKIVKINEANIYQLMEVKGIGSYIAQKVVDYRERLGGFVSLDQIDEITSLKPEQIELIKQSITIDLENIKKTKINVATEADLRNHPYLTFKQAQIIKLFQKNNGNLRNEADFKKIGIFTDEQIASMRPYLEY